MKDIVILLALLPLVLVGQTCTSQDSLRHPPDFYDVVWDDDFEPDSYLRVDYFQEDFIFVLQSNSHDTIVYWSAFPTPKQFRHLLRVDSHLVSRSTMEYRKDSIFVIDYEGIDSFYRFSDSLRVDTIEITNEKELHIGDLDHYTISGYCEYRHKIKHGIEKQFYSVNELRGKVVDARNFHIKAEGKWKNGGKHGKWRYYAPNGKLQRIEKWRNGKLKRTHTKQQ